MHYNTNIIMYELLLPALGILNDGFLLFHEDRNELRLTSITQCYEFRVTEVISRSFRSSRNDENPSFLDTWVTVHVTSFFRILCGVQPQLSAHCCDVVATYFFFFEKPFFSRQFALKSSAKTVKITYIYNTTKEHCQKFSAQCFLYLHT